MKYFTFTYYLITFLLTQELYSKSISSQELGSNRDNFNSETDPEQLGIEEDVNIHESYRPRHKYKVGTGHQEISKRLSKNGNEVQEIKTPQCAVMFKNNEPVGILQPYEDSYKFIPVNGEPTIVDISPVSIKRKSIIDVLYPSNIDDEYEDHKSDQRVGFADERYPSIFAKFKIDSRMDKVLGTNTNMKRSMVKRDSEIPSISDNQMGSLKTTLSKMKSGNSVEVEEELRNILDDMGLIDDYQDKDIKREVTETDEKQQQAEDENLELSTNKINLVKEGLKEKREDSESTSTKEQSTMGVQTESEIKESIKESETDVSKSDNVANIECSSDKSEKNKEKRQDKSSLDNEPRKKRAKENNERDLAVSENDMPILDSTPISLVKESELSQYEKRVEREIRDKIQKLKEEVKKEIDELKSNKNKVDTKRKKRQVVNTLIEEESKDLDPTFNDIENQKEHIRSKRENDYYKTPTAPENYQYSPGTYTRSSNNNNNNNTQYMKINSLSKYSEDNSNVTSYRTRTLKLYDSDNNTHIENKKNWLEENHTKIRRKREADEEQGDSSDQEDEAEFSEENDQPSQNNVNADKSDVAENALNKQKNCHCDKDGSNCRCDNSQISDEALFKVKDYSNLDFNPLSLEKKAAKHGCECDKNGNCKCKKQFSDLSSSLKQEYLEYDDSNEMNKRSNNLNGKEYLDESRSNFEFNLPRLKTMKRKIYIPNQENSPIEDEVDNQELDSNNLLKREINTRKFAANKPFENGEYFIDLHPDVYRLTPVENLREKRDDFNSLVAIHGGGPVRSHLVAIRQRSMLPHSRFRRRIQVEDNKEPRQLIDMSDEDLFGALPQNFEGELARYKRVKRNRAIK